MSTFLDAHWCQTTPDQLRAAIDRSGAALMRNMISRADAEQLAEGIDRAFNAFDLGDTENGWYVPFASKTSDASVYRSWLRQCGGLLAVDSPPLLGQLVEIYRRSGIIDWVHAFLGEKPVLSSQKTTLRLTTAETVSVGWHQDGAFLGEDARVLNIWLALTPCGEDALGLDLALRRMPGVVGAGEDGADYHWSVSDSRAIREAGDIVSPILAPGDAIVFDHLCLHRTGQLAATRTRRAIEAWFFAPATLPNSYDAVPV